MVISGVQQFGGFGAPQVGGAAGPGAGQAGLSPEEQQNLLLQELMKALTGGPEGQPDTQKIEELLGLIAIADPELAQQLLQALRGGSGSIPGAGASGGGGGGGGMAPMARVTGGGSSAMVNGTGIPQFGNGSLAALTAGQAIPSAGGNAQARLDGLTQDLASRSPLFAQLANQFPGAVTASNLPDPAGGDLRGLYDPNTNQIALDTDNLGNGPEAQRTLAEEYAHRVISQSTLTQNPGTNVSNQANEVIAKTYANLVMAEASGQQLTPQVMDQAINQAMADVARNYGSVPQGNYGALLQNFFNNVNIPGEDLLGQKLAGAFNASGFVA